MKRWRRIESKARAAVGGHVVVEWEQSEGPPRLSRRRLATIILAVIYNGRAPNLGHLDRRVVEVEGHLGSLLPRLKVHLRGDSLLKAIEHRILGNELAVIFGWLEVAALDNRRIG